MSNVNMTGSFAGTSTFGGQQTVASPQVLFKPAFASILQGLTNLTAPLAVTWYYDPQPFVSPVDAARVQLRLRSLKTRGIDDFRPDVTSGNRDVCISVRCETYNLSVESAELADQILSGLMVQATSLALGNIGLSYMKSSAVNDISYEQDDRWVNCSVFDLWLNGVINSVASVDGTGNILTVNGPTNYVPGVLSL